MRRQGAAHVDDRHLQRGGHAGPAAGRARLGRGRAPADGQVRPSHVRVDERGQVAGMDAVLEVLAVHPGQIVVPLFRALRTAVVTKRYGGHRATEGTEGGGRCRLLLLRSAATDREIGGKKRDSV